jgi:hypothetical protein
LVIAGKKPKAGTMEELLHLLAMIGAFAKRCWYAWMKL